MKQKLYHGTSADNLADIMVRGLVAETGGKLWTCSGESVYFWSPNRLSELGECDAEDSDSRARQYAIESAQFALSVASDCRIVVVCAEIDCSEVEIDQSCPNTESSGAVCVPRDVSPSEIVSIEVSNDLSLLRGFFLSMALDREYSAVEMTRTEEKIARALSKAEIYPEDVDEMIEMKPIDITTNERVCA